MLHRRRVAFVWWLGVTGCVGGDDEPDDPDEVTDASTDAPVGGGIDVCQAAADEHFAACIAGGEAWFLDTDTPGGHAIPRDDPSAMPLDGGVFLPVAASDWVGSYGFDGGTCTVGCATCQRGQAACMGTLTADGRPSCLFCIPAAEADPQAACVGFLAACDPE
jgi:hypothetical protein